MGRAVRLVLERLAWAQMLTSRTGIAGRVWFTMQCFQVINDDVMGGRSRSRVLRTEAPPLRLADVRVFGLLISEGQGGPFRVELELPRAG